MCADFGTHPILNTFEGMRIMYDQDGIIVVDYINKIVAFFVEVQKERRGRAAKEMKDEDLPWSSILEAKTRKPLPVPSVHFAGKELDFSSPDIIRQLDEIVARLNDTEDFLVWKRGINKMYKILQPSRTENFYSGEDCNPDLSLEEPVEDGEPD